MGGGGKRNYVGQAASPSYLTPHTTDTALESPRYKSATVRGMRKVAGILDAWNTVQAKNTHHDVSICGAISFHEPVELQQLVVTLQTVRDVGLLPLDVAPAIVAKADEGAGPVLEYKESAKIRDKNRNTRAIVAKTQNAYADNTMHPRRVGVRPWKPGERRAGAYVSQVLQNTLHAANTVTRDIRSNSRTQLLTHSAYKPAPLVGGTHLLTETRKSPETGLNDSSVLAVVTWFMLSTNGTRT